jgi:hypothetical protein
MSRNSKNQEIFKELHDKWKHNNHKFFCFAMIKKRPRGTFSGLLKRFIFFRGSERTKISAAGKPSYYEKQNEIPRRNEQKRMGFNAFGLVEKRREDLTVFLLPVFPEFMGILLDPVPNRFVAQVISGFFRFYPFMF